MKIVVKSFGTDADKDEYFKVVARTVMHHLKKKWKEMPKGVELSFLCLKQTAEVDVELVTVCHTMTKDEGETRFLYALVNLITTMKRKCELEISNFL